MQPEVHEHTRLLFETGWPAFIGLAVALVAAVVLIVVHVRSHRSAAARFRRPALALRLCALALLVWCICQPNLTRTITTTYSARVLVLADRSKSMALRDSPDRPTRYEAQEKVLADAGAGLLPALRRRFDTQVFAFAETAQPLGRDKVQATVHPDGVVTDVGAAISDAMRTSKGGPLAGVVVMSDGQHNGPRDPLAASRKVGAPVYTVGLGRDPAAETKDLALDNVQAPARAIKGEPVVFVATVSARGYLDEVVPLDLIHGDRALVTHLVRFSRVDDTQQVRLRYVPREVGYFDYQVTIGKDVKEKIRDNNFRSVGLQVIDPKVRVLYVEGELRFEYKFLRRALSRLPNVHLRCLVELKRGTFYVQTGPQGDGDRPRRAGPQTVGFPSPDELPDYDVLIVGDIDAAAFTPEQLLAINRFVREKGKGLVMLAGRRSFGAGAYKGTPMADTLPVKLDLPGLQQSYDPFQPRVTPDGRHHPLLRLLGDAAKNRELWSRVPRLTGCTLVGTARAGAQVLLEHPTRSVSDRPVVILAAQRYGKGKSVALAVDTTWQWSFTPLGSGPQDTVHSGFWRQVVRWLTSEQPDEDKKGQLVRATCEFSRYRRGETVVLEARVLNRQRVLTSDAQVVAEITTPDGAQMTLNLQNVAKVPGKYVTRFPVRREGQYGITVSAHHAGSAVGHDKLAIRVEPLDLELANTRPNHELLKEIARVGGGRFYTPDHAELIARELKPSQSQSTLTTPPRRLWHSGWLLGAVIALACGEWYWRRRYNLK